MKLPCMRCHRVLVDSTPLCSGCATGGVCAHGVLVGGACDYCGTARVAPRPEDSLSIRTADGTKITQYGDGAVMVEAGAQAFTIEAGAADERPAPDALPVECGNCGRMLFASPGRWILCTCETQTTVLP